MDLFEDVVNPDVYPYARVYSISIISAFHTAILYNLPYPVCFALEISSSHP
jgi:hypothetical protein